MSQHSKFPFPLIALLSLGTILGSLWLWKHNYSIPNSQTLSINTPIQSSNETDQPSQSPLTGTNPNQLKENLNRKFGQFSPKEWSEHATGVKTRLDTQDKVIALTFDACGGDGKNGYDEKLISYLEKENIPATLFIGGKWIEANPQTFKELAANPLFEIENHGTRHIPCSTNGQSAYGIDGTKNISEISDEMELNAQTIDQLTGRKPRFFRAGTAYTDEICPQIAKELGYQVVSFNVLGDAGATYPKDKIKEVLLNAHPGSIVLLHMNHPEKETAQGLMEAIPELKKKGVKFVKLEEYPLE